MKQYVTLLLVGTLGLASCSQDSITEKGLDSANKIAIKLDVSAPLSQSVYNELDELFNTQFDAFSGAFGYITGTAGLITARTALQLGVAVVGRTLGWVGVHGPSMIMENV